MELKARSKLSTHAESGMLKYSSRRGYYEYVRILYGTDLGNEDAHITVICHSVESRAWRTTLACLRRAKLMFFCHRAFIALMLMYGRMRFGKRHLVRKKTGE